MQIYSREFSDEEVLAIGADGFKKIDSLVSSFIAVATRVKNTSNTTSRVLDLIHDHPMNVVDVLQVYRARYGNTPPLGSNYARKVINDLFAAGMLTRVSHGRYVRKDI